MISSAGSGHRRDVTGEEGVSTGVDLSVPKSTRQIGELVAMESQT